MLPPFQVQEWYFSKMKCQNSRTASEIIFVVDVVNCIPEVIINLLFRFSFPLLSYTLLDVMPGILVCSLIVVSIELPTKLVQILISIFYLMQMSLHELNCLWIYSARFFQICKNENMKISMRFDLSRFSLL